MKPSLLKTPKLTSMSLTSSKQKKVKEKRPSTSQLKQEDHESINLREEDSASKTSMDGVPP